MPCDIDTPLSILGENGNLRAESIRSGDVHMVEGVARHPIHVLQEPRFMQAFLDKGRFKDLMRRIPVHVITARAAFVAAINPRVRNAKD
jgi:glucokinase